MSTTQLRSQHLAETQITHRERERGGGGGGFQRECVMIAKKFKMIDQMSQTRIQDQKKLNKITYMNNKKQHKQEFILIICFAFL